MKHGEILVCVWGEDWCDDEYSIIDSNGFSLEVLIEIDNEIQNSIELDKYREKELTIKPIYDTGQIGNYEPPNVEILPHWDLDIVNVRDLSIDI